MHDNIIDEPSGNSTEFGIAGLIILICGLALAGEQADKISYIRENRPTPIIKKCVHQSLSSVQAHQMANKVKTFAKE